MRQTAEVEENANSVELESEEPSIDLNEVEMPPMVVRSPAYRCDDGKALYVDVLTSEDVVLVRDSRTDTPTRLARDEGNGPFIGENRSLSGIGAEIRYSSSDRPDQACRQSEG